MKIARRVASCEECPHRRYATAGQYECTLIETPLPEAKGLPAWCPLPDDPAAIAASAELRLERAKAVLARATQEAADQLVSAARLRELMVEVADRLAGL